MTSWERKPSLQVCEFWFACFADRAGVRAADHRPDPRLRRLDARVFPARRDAADRLPARLQARDTVARLHVRDHVHHDVPQHR